VHKNKLTQKYPTIKTEKDMFKPRENITAGTDIFSAYMKSAGGGVVKAMTAYSGGSSSHWEKVNNVVSQIKIKYNEFYKG
jgi:soluble lytic murein transglycosylase-like protein